MKRILAGFIISSLWLLVACNSSYTPKPSGYYKIPFPEKKYQVFDRPDYPYSFEFPVYAKVVKDSTFFGEATENPWWINIDFPQWMVKELDQEATRLGVPRQSVIKFWISEKLEK